MTGRPRAAVIGAGVGGLAAAIRLARAGLAVDLFERSHEVGGKLREVKIPGAGKPFDAGPSVLTMRWVFEELLGGPLSEHLSLVPLEPLCRHFFADGSSLDLFSDEERSTQAIRAFAGPADADGYRRMRKKAAAIYEICRKNFLTRAQPSLVGMMHPEVLAGVAQLDSHVTLWNGLSRYFHDPRLRQLFARYATYNGSDPFRAPATLQVIIHVENALGVWACPDGLYRLAEALRGAAEKLGVTIHAHTAVEEILIARAGDDAFISRGVRAGGREHHADVVVANCDAAALYGQLLPAAVGERAAKRFARNEPSLSAFVMLAELARIPLPLAHHNVFFSPDYEREFAELRDHEIPEQPTVYLCAQDRVTGEPTHNHERAFLLTNAPAIRDGDEPWAGRKAIARQRTLDVLASHVQRSFPHWKPKPDGERLITPDDFAERFPYSRGALYGLSSNSTFAAFRRPSNRVENVRGLYAVGGSVHPGAGLPLVALSARIAVDAAIADLRREGVQ